MKLNTQYLAYGYLAILSTLLWFYYGEYQNKAEEYSRLKRQYDEQAAITDNAYHSIRLFNDISRINSENRQRSAVDSEKTQTAIKQVVVNHDCAHRTVPDGAVSRLQQHANRIHSGAADTHSGTSAR